MKYPDHPYINLSGSLLLYLINDAANESEPLKRIESIDDLSDGCIIDISLSSKYKVDPYRNLIY